MIEDKKLAVDLDGILTVYDGLKSSSDFETLNPLDLEKVYRHAKPNKKMIFYINSFYEDNVVNIYTARVEFHRDTTNIWLEEHGVMYHNLYMNKLHYDAFIDDRAANNISDFDKLLRE